MDFGKLSGFWFKESEISKELFEYMHISECGRRVISSCIIGLDPIKIIFFQADIRIQGSSILVTNLNTQVTRENYVNIGFNELEWSVDGVKYRTWKKLSSDSLSKVPEKIIQHALL